MKCPICDFENGDRTTCKVCGKKLKDTPEDIEVIPQKTNENEINKNNIEKTQEINKKTENIQNTQTPQQIPNHNYNQQNSQQYGQQQQQQYTRPFNQKSKAIGFILNFLIVGAGYCYVDMWGEGITLFILCFICGFLGMFLIFPLIIPPLIWLYGIIDIFGKVNKYNRGEPLKLF